MSQTSDQDQSGHLRFPCTGDRCGADLAETASKHGDPDSGELTGKVVCGTCATVQDPPAGLLDYLDHYRPDGDPTTVKTAIVRRTSGEFEAFIGKHQFDPGRDDDEEDGAELRLQLVVTGVAARDLNAVLSTIKRHVWIKMTARPVAEYQLILWPVVDQVAS